MDEDEPETIEKGLWSIVMHDQIVCEELKVDPDRGLVENGSKRERLTNESQSQQVDTTSRRVLSFARQLISVLGDSLAHLLIELGKRVLNSLVATSKKLKKKKTITTVLSVDRPSEEECLAIGDGGNNQQSSAKQSAASNIVGLVVPAGVLGNERESVYSLVDG